MTSRQQVRTLVEHKRFQLAVITVIIANAVTLGMETSTKLTAETHGLLHVLDRIALGLFVIELALRLYAYGWKFFTDPWSVFDFVVIAIALVPATGPFSVLRTLRVLRILRLMTAVPAMKRVVSALLAAVPGLASIAALLSLILYVAAVMATQMFRHAAPQYFDDIGTSLFTLFQTMTGEAWPDVARTVMKEDPIAWIFFVIYIVVCTLAVLNILIAVIVSGMEQANTEGIVALAEQEVESDKMLLDEIRQLRAEVAELRAELSPRSG